MRYLIALAFLTGIASAQAQGIPACAPHDEMAATLLSKVKEHPVGIGITQDRSLMEVYASLAGTWTIVQTDMTSGQACIKAFGVNYQARSIPKPEQGI